MPDLNDLLDQVDEIRDEIVALERDMVRIPTVNTGFMPTGNETELCRYIEKWLAEDGVACEIIESAPGRGNLIARLEGSSGRAGLMFMSHLDVVPVEEEEKWRFPPFSTTVADGRVFGCGASDCKALLTCQLIALHRAEPPGIPRYAGLQPLPEGGRNSDAASGGRGIAYLDPGPATVHGRAVAGPAAGGLSWLGPQHRRYPPGGVHPTVTGVCRFADHSRRELCPTACMLP